MRIAFFVNSIAGESPHFTTTTLALAALGRGHDVCYVTPSDFVLRADDSLDVFGVHGLGGIVGALLTGVFSAEALGGTKAASAGYDIAVQTGIQALGVLVTLAWIAPVSLLALAIARRTCGGLRVDEDDERMGLDIASHGENAYSG